MLLEVHTKVSGGENGHCPVTDLLERRKGKTFGGVCGGGASASGFDSLLKVMMMMMMMMVAVAMQNNAMPG